MNDERKAIQKIRESFLTWEPQGSNGIAHCQTDKDLMIKYLLQRVFFLETRLHQLEVKSRGADRSGEADAPSEDFH